MQTVTAEKIVESPQRNADGGLELVPRVETITERGDWRERESLSENFNNEIEAWARHSLATNGFGDY